MAENEDGRVKEKCVFLKRVLSSILIKKKMQWNEETELARYITFKDTLLFTTAIVLASFYEGMPRIISTYGYMIFFPLLLSGMMSFITSICFAELISLNPNSGGCYRYVYYTMGELMGFLVGWSVIYTSFMEIVNSTEIITHKLDKSLFGGQIGNFTARNLQLGGLENYFLQILPNAHLHNLVVSMAIAEGAVEGHLFYMDFEVASYAGSESVNPTVSLPTGLVEGFQIGFMIYMGSIILYSARMGAAEQNVSDPVMKNALWNLGFKHFCYLPPIGLIICHYLSGRAALYEGSRVIYTMAKDGLIFSIFGRVHPKFRNPYNAHIAIAVICYLVSVFIGIAPSTKWSLIAMETIVRIMVLLAYLMTRYRCESDEQTYEEKDVHKKRWVLTNCPHSLNIPNKTTETISVWLIFLTVITIISAEFIMMFYIIGTNNNQLFLRLSFITSLVIAFISVHLLNQQPINERKHFPYKVRGMPFTPILAITWYTLILMFLPSVIWVKMFCWWIIGILFYFSYACLRSKEFKKWESGSTPGISLPPS
ncbi:methylthioribose transporter isoform X4 [Halyomorpha halys]|uniref:methylthioribose transporter isoform X4 n=1 Tax=Halyomorpha halys TaxID=286706 RepID=UPI0034D2BF3B